MEKKTNERHYPADELEEAFQDFCLDCSCGKSCRVAEAMGPDRAGKSISDCFDVWKGMEYVPAEGSAVLG